MRPLRIACIGSLLMALLISGCKKKMALPPPPPPPAAAAEAPAEPAPEPPAPPPAEPPAPAPEPEPSTTTPAVTFSEELARLLQDAYFDFDRHDIRADAREVLLRNGDALRNLLERFPGGQAKIEGHADERGSAEYNLGLGDRRATSAREFLTALGVPGQRLGTISFGKERPQCNDQTEDCWQRNRRVHFAAE